MNYLEEKIFDVLKNAVTLMEGQDYVGAEKKLDIYYQAKKFIEDKSTLADSIADGLRKVRAHNILADEAASDDAKVLAKVIALMPTGTTIAIPIRQQQPVASTQRPTQQPHRQSTQASPQGQVLPVTTQPTQQPQPSQVPTTPPATTTPATPATTTTPTFSGTVPPTVTTPVTTPTTPTQPATPATPTPSQGPVLPAQPNKRKKILNWLEGKR